MIILGVDTSCDDTSIAVLRDHEVLANVVSSQVPIHALFGGVVPEIASRQHVEVIDTMLGEALNEAGVTLRDIEILSVTQGPGLIGSLLVGLCFAKGLALSLGRRLVGVNHVEAHAMSIFLEERVEFPFVSLIVSGGHTVILLFSGPTDFRVLGSTRDDAAGEAFDKIAKYLGLGYPGGKIIEEMASAGDPEYVSFPRPMADENNFDFSFSGLKTAFINHVKKYGISDGNRCDLLASFQEAACDVLSSKTVKAALNAGVRRVVIGGGVACNMRLRTAVADRCGDMGISVSVPSPELCMDNGAMIAMAASFYAGKGIFSPMDIRAFSRMRW